MRGRLWTTGWAGVDSWEKRNTWDESHICPSFLLRTSCPTHKERKWKSACMKEQIAKVLSSAEETGIWRAGYQRIGKCNGSMVRSLRSLAEDWALLQRMRHQKALGRTAALELRAGWRCQRSGVTEWRWVLAHLQCNGFAEHLGHSIETPHFGKKNHCLQ